MAAESKRKFMEWAQIAMQADRLEDAAFALKAAVKTEEELDDQEVMTLASVYKTIITARRSAWMVMVSAAKQVENSENRLQIIQKYKQEIEAEIKKICFEVLHLLDYYLLPKAATAEMRVFFLKMKGDYYRYLVEITEGQERIELVNEVQKSYEDAFCHSVDLSPLHYARLALALNFSVFLYDILEMKEEAQELAKQAVDEAKEERQTLVDEQYSDSTLLIHLLQINLAMWLFDSENESTESEELQSDLCLAKTDENSM